MLEALRATIGTQLIARPTKGLREGCGYYVASGYVWWYDKMQLTPARKRADWLPPWEVVSGEWEAVRV